MMRIEINSYAYESINTVAGSECEEQLRRARAGAKGWIRLGGDINTDDAHRAHRRGGTGSSFLAKSCGGANGAAGGGSPAGFAGFGCGDCGVADGGRT